MNAEIIAVGSELLTPEKVDTNSLYLTQHLNDLGIEVVAKCIIGDDRTRLTNEIRSSSSRSELVLLTGGLGPTEDDVTRDACAAALGLSQHFDPAIWEAIIERFSRFGRTPSENNRRQANVLAGAEVLPNPNGTAPGLWLSPAPHRYVALLPGPPRELKPMVQDQILPRLRQLIPPSVIRTRWYRVAGIGESDLDSLIAPIYTQFTNPVTTILAAPGDVHIHFRARTDDDAEAERLLAAVADPIVALLGDRIYSSDGATLEQTVGRLLLGQHATLATAESITAGLLGGRITDTSGSSAYYAGGFQTYTDAMKTKLLGVDPALLAAHTAVSEPVALAMAQAARERTGATYALSLTGYAEGDQAGLCFAGLATPQHVHCRQLKLFGDRHRVRGLAVIQALDWLRKTLHHP